ncbi:Crp/Fnr family transcriptional regulator [Sphingomonas sp. NBWT7]|uniref:Crp/Fnr family transcriptional regulator n=1 Tax=Sphingomonas sp. NBWT7 TaxID=2596913 RepID=UPI001626AC3E|nr:Crp/Fnr family transcriptional regulator [Sphingomonas sp. NBWT7]QNE32314.1 Crp/Fnr family transcriptional regulator [Sphingomonas sp. NBWT7]
MPSNSFADRLGEHVVLTEGERTALQLLDDRERAVRRGGALCRENDAVADFFILKRGMLMSFVILNDGSRQILRFILPGDIVSLSTLAYARATETISALADSVVGMFDRSAMARVLRDHPRLYAAMMALDQVTRAALSDRVASLGRTSARARVASVLLEIRDRMRRLDPAFPTSFALGLTQEEIGDATGLTAVHVNRMLRQLEDERLIARAGGCVTLIDEARLVRAAHYVDRMTGVDLSWLSSPS